MSIEAIELADVPVLKTISERCLTESVVLQEAERNLLIEHTASNVEEYSQKSDCIFQKFVSDGTVSGYILLKQYWNLSDLFVLPEFQGFGIGRDLLTNTIAQAKFSGRCEEIWVNSSLNAEQFYRKMGFQDRTDRMKRSENNVPLRLRFN